MQDCLTKLINNEQLTRVEVEQICSLAIPILILEPNIPLVSSPLMIVGDIHGQYLDLLNIFHLFNTPESRKFIFLGDYVDRGRNSVSTYLLLLTYKILFPNNIYLVRGNHEIYNLKSSFHDEILKKYDEEIYERITETFKYLLMGCIVDGRYLCVHGGISPGATRISKMQRINRFLKNPSPIFSDIMWSDPSSAAGFELSQRGAGYLFGGDMAERFLNLNQLNYIVRSHQMVYSGFQFSFKHSCLVTVWSAPNYMYRFGNKASVLEIKKQKKLVDEDFKVFKEVRERE